MLTTNRLLRVSIAALTAVGAALAIFTLGTVPAAAEEKCTYVNYVLTCTEVTTGGTPGQPGGSGNDSEPTCDLDSVPPVEFDKNRSANFCIGTEVCYTRDLLPPLELPEGDKPNEDSVARSTLCSNGFTTRVERVFWSDDEEPPSLLEQARSAIDQLEFTTPTVGVSPAARTLVNLDTWFWLEGLQPEVTATAFTVTARATLQSMTVNPGDGSAAFVCDPVATSSAIAEKSCLHEYRKASGRGGSFAATVTTVYGLSFTAGGDPLTIAGTPATIDGPPSTTAVRVDEAQTVVRPSR